MNPTEQYKANRANRWTRIEVLLGLYDGAINALQQAADAADRGDDFRATQQLIQAQRFVTGIVTGVDPGAGEIARNVERLCLFVVERLADRDFAAALRVLTALREGFEAIRPEAVAMERAGQIPEFRDRSAIRTEA